MTPRPRCRACGVLSVPLPGDLCTPCKAEDSAAEAKLLKDLNKP